MTIQLVAHPFQLLSQQHEVMSSPDQPKKFINICLAESLTSRLVKLENDACWKTAWATAAFVAFMIVAIGGFVAVGVFAPAYLSMAGFLALALAVPVSSFSGELYTASKAIEDQALQCRKLQEIYNNLTAKEPRELQKTLSSMGIAETQTDLPRLVSLLAYARQLESTILELQTLEASDATTANELEGRAQPAGRSNRQEINQCRTRVLRRRDSILLVKIEAAFVNATLRNPDTTETLKDLVTFSTLTSEDRLFQQAVNGRSDDTFLTCNNGGATMTVDLVTRLHVNELGRILFRTMNQNRSHPAED